MIPDIASSLEQPGAGNVGARYVGWVRQWLEPKFTDATGHVMLSAENVYQARCSLLHAGTAEIAPRKRADIDQFEFFSSSGNHFIKVGGMTVNGIPQPAYLAVDVATFCTDIFDAAEAWETSTASNASVQQEKAKLLTIREPGILLGGGIRFL